MSSHLPLFLSHQIRLTLTAADLFMFCSSQFVVLNMTKRRSNRRPSSNQSSKRRSTAHQQPNANNDDNSEQSSEHPTSMNLFSSSSVLIPLHSRRLHSAQTQHFHIITSNNNQNLFLLLGSTANEYTITVTSSSILCNCQDSHKGCKHILFLCHALGLIRMGDNHILTHPTTFRSLLSSLLSAEFKPPLLAASLLDTHTNFLCSRHAYPPLFFLRQGTISRCFHTHHLFKMWLPWTQTVLSTRFHYRVSLSQVFSSLLQFAVTCGQGIL